MTTILLLTVIGIAAILAELLLPGGILGVIGAGCLVAAVVTTFLEFGAGAGAVATIVLFAFGLLLLGGWMKFFHRLPVTRRLILEDATGAPDEEKREERQALLGKRGHALTDLHPSGRAVVEGRRYDVMTEGPEIGKDAPIEIIDVRGPSIFVRAIEEEG